jgi:outer membrane phospholipase A
MTILKNTKYQFITVSKFKNDFFETFNCSKTYVLKIQFLDFQISNFSKLNIFESAKFNFWILKMLKMNIFDFLILRFCKILKGFGAKHQQGGLGKSTLRSKKWISLVHTCVPIFFPITSIFTGDI